MCEVFLLDGIGNTVHRLIHHVYIFCFGSVGTIFFYSRQCFFHFIHFKVSQFPVLILSCKPEFGMVNLYALHEFAQSWFIRISNLLL
jgi:hypothetical protein